MRGLTGLDLGTVDRLISPSPGLFDDLARRLAAELTGEILKPWPRLRLYAQQEQFLASPSWCRAFVGGRGAGKAFGLETPVPTPTGWATLGDIRAGDRVLDERGRPCRVTATTEVMLGRPCYRVAFSDGTAVIADAEHEWPVARKGGGWSTGTTRRIADSIRQGSATPVYQSQRYIIACEPVPSVPVRCIEVDSPSHLYLIGEGMIPTHNSHIGVYDLLLRAKAGRLYLVVGPTFGDIRDSTQRSFFEVCDQLGCLKRYNRVDNIAWVHTQDGGTATVLFKSATLPENLRGPNLSGCYCDEASLYKEDAIKIVIACLRERGEMGFLTMTMTPKGKGHWTYGWFFDAEGNLRQNRELVRASSKDNPFLPPEFYNIMAAEYTPGSMLARQELEGEFVDLVGLLFQYAWFNIVASDAVPQNAHRVRYWDKAGTQGGGDYSAGVLMARDGLGNLYVEDVVRGQWSPAKRNEIMLATARADALRYNNSVAIWAEQEPGSGGKESALLTLDLLREFPTWVEPVRGDKITRSRPLASQAEVGRVHVVDAEWTRAFLDEICGFPDAKHDDQVDAASGACNHLATWAVLSEGDDHFSYNVSGVNDHDRAAATASLPTTDNDKDLLEWLQLYANADSS